MKLRFTTIRGAIKGDRFRTSNWYDSVNDVEMFGVEVRLDYGVWVHVAGHDNKFFASTDKSAAKAFIKNIEDLKRAEEGSP